MQTTIAYIRKRGFNFGVLIVIGLSFVACTTQTFSDHPSSEPTNAPGLIASGQKKPDIRGKITRVGTRNGIVTSIFVEGALTEDTPYHQVIVAIDSETRVFDDRNQELVEVSPNTLAVGQTVEALFTDVIMESLPLQALSREILILPEE